MSEWTRRKWIKIGAATVAGAGALGVAAKLAAKYGLVPPDSGGVYGPGETLTYAAQRVVRGAAPARQFSRSQISAQPFANETQPLGDDFKKSQDAGFTDWRLKVDGLVERPGTYSLAELKAMPRSSQITMVQCEEGWSYIAEWIGTPLVHLLGVVGAAPQTKYVVYRSLQTDWWESIDMADALHPETILAYGMNGGELPVGFGGPLRLRVPRALGYKSVKYLTSMTLTDDIRKFGKGLGSASPEAGYAWYAGI